MLNESTIRQIAKQTLPNSSFNIMLAEIDRLRAIVGCDGTECPFCHVGKLTPRIRAGDFGDVTVQGLEGYVCDNCPSEPIFPDQIRRNEQRVKRCSQRTQRRFRAWMSFSTWLLASA
jgi:hypothetical protein